MTAYRQTFRRHRRLLSVPIVLATFVALWSVLASPKMYESSASLWVDTGPGVDSSVANANPALPSPAEQEQSVLAELLKTRGFRLTIGHKGPLANYLATHDSHGWGPTSVLSALRGRDPLDHRVVSALSAKQVTTTIGGPQVLQISYLGPTPAVTTGTLKALLSELERQSSRLAESRSRQAVSFYQNQLDGAKKAVADARQQVTAYLANHPTTVSATDPMLRALRQAQGQATGRLARATANFNLASGAVRSPASGPSTIEVLDAPAVPTAPTSGKKKAIVGVIGGLFAGALISFLGVVLLTPSTPEAATPELGRRRNGVPAETHEPEPLSGAAADRAEELFRRIWESELEWPGGDRPARTREQDPWDEAPDEQDPWDDAAEPQQQEEPAQKRPAARKSRKHDESSTSGRRSGAPRAEDRS